MKLNLRLLSYYSKLCGVPVEYFFETDLLSPVSFDKKVSAFDEEETVNKELSELLLSFTIEERKKLINILKIWKSE